MLESSRGDDLKDPARPVTGVPKGVPLVTGFELYLRERGKGGAPSRILLDFDATDDPVHGDQEGGYYHGFYEERILHPLLVFDGETNQLIAAILRPGNTHA